MMGDDLNGGDFDAADLTEVSAVSPFVVDVEGYEGPIDVLLSLARDQKVDLIHISIVELADQYLKFVQEASHHNLELAADYLVMAAWLAYLKSRLLLPVLGTEDEPSGEELAAALQFQLQRLESMQESGARLMARAMLGVDYFSRGAPERFRTQVHTVLDATLTDLIEAYASQMSRATKGKALNIEASWELHSVEDALARLRRLVGHAPGWQDLMAFLPGDLSNPLTRRSATATTFAAALELAKEGRVKIRQDGTFAPIYFETTDAWSAPRAESAVDTDDQDTETDET